MGSPNLVFILLSHLKKNSDGPEKFRKLHVIMTYSQNRRSSAKI